MMTKLTLDFRILDWGPSADPVLVNGFAEGHLAVRIAGTSVLELEGILLVEMAVCAGLWLFRRERGEHVPFHYASMDFEDEPVLAFVPDGPDSMVRVESAFAEGELGRVSLRAAELAAQTFVAAVRRELLAELDVDLDSIVERAIAENPRLWSLETDQVRGDR